MMRKACAFTMALMLATVGFGSCSKSAEQPKPAAPAPARAEAPSAAAQTSAPAPAPESKPATPAAAPATAAAPAAAPQGSGTGLSGTKWMLGDLTVTFKDASTAVVTGGPLAAVAPNGLEASYTLKDNALEVKAPALGITKTGTFDGTKLVIDGKTAVKAQ
jgi:hypothetical protein